MDLTPHIASQVNNYNHKTAETLSQRVLRAKRPMHWIIASRWILGSLEYKCIIAAGDNRNETQPSPTELSLLR